MNKKRKASGELLAKAPEATIKSERRYKCTKIINKINITSKVLMSHIITIEQINVNFDIIVAVIIGKLLNSIVIVMEHSSNHLSFSGPNPKNKLFFIERIHSYER
jgi:hypothetical protein